MDQSVVGEPVPDDAGRDVTAGLARDRLLEQVAVLAARVPGHRLTVETWPGRGDRIVAQAIRPAARPYLVVTDDLDELSAELAGPPAAGISPPTAPRAGDEKR